MAAAETAKEYAKSAENAHDLKAIIAADAESQASAHLAARHARVARDAADAAEHAATSAIANNERAEQAAAAADEEGSTAREAADQSEVDADEAAATAQTSQDLVEKASAAETAAKTAHEAAAEAREAALIAAQASFRARSTIIFPARSKAARDAAGDSEAAAAAATSAGRAAATVNEVVKVADTEAAHAAAAAARRASDSAVDARECADTIAIDAANNAAHAQSAAADAQAAAESSADAAAAASDAADHAATAAQRALRVASDARQCPVDQDWAKFNTKITEAIMAFLELLPTPTNPEDDDLEGLKNARDAWLDLNELISDQHDKLAAQHVTSVLPEEISILRGAHIALAETSSSLRRAATTLAATIQKRIVAAGDPRQIQDRALRDLAEKALQQQEDKITEIHNIITEEIDSTTSRNQLTSEYLDTYYQALFAFSNCVLSLDGLRTRPPFPLEISGQRETITREYQEFTSAMDGLEKLSDRELPHLLTELSQRLAQGEVLVEAVAAFQEQMERYVNHTRELLANHNDFLPGGRVPVLVRLLATMADKYQGAIDDAETTIVTWTTKRHSIDAMLKDATAFVDYILRLIPNVD